jgi:putative flippase GtrA
MKSSARLVVAYALIASLATVANLGAQMLVVWAYSGARAVELSILVGTAVGLPIKYLLEKRYVFDFRARNLVHDGSVFVMYSLLGVFTTFIFWGTEYAFHVVFHSDTMRYIGGALGLTLGYYIKYLLDRRYVFVHRSAAGSST